MEEYNYHGGSSLHVPDRVVFWITFLVCQPPHLIGSGDLWIAQVPLTANNRLELAHQVTSKIPLCSQVWQTHSQPIPHTLPWSPQARCCDRPSVPCGIHIRYQYGGRTTRHTPPLSFRVLALLKGLQHSQMGETGAWLIREDQQVPEVIQVPWHIPYFLFQFVGRHPFSVSTLTLT